MRFNNMNFSDGHYVQIPTSWDAQEFTYRFLSATPPWVRMIMQVRNRVVQKTRVYSTALIEIQAIGGRGWFISGPLYFY